MVGKGGEGHNEGPHISVKQAERSVSMTNAAVPVK